MEEINGHMSYLPASEEPLSADVYFIKGKEYNYIVDVGMNDEALKAVSDCPRRKVIISHFHEDPPGNVPRRDIRDEDVLVGAYSAKVLKRGTVVRKKVSFDDGHLIEIIPMPSSHEKGCLAVLIDRDILIMGDSFYGHNDKGYNVSLLYDQIRVLNDLEFNTAVMSHDERRHSKKKVIRLLEMYYSRRVQGQDYINPAIDSIFNNMAKEAWKEVSNVRGG